MFLVKKWYFWSLFRSRGKQQPIVSCFFFLEDSREVGAVTDGTDDYSYIFNKPTQYATIFCGKLE